jgi:pimeloyl-ACP methyl ester carboxylesterase
MMLIVILRLVANISVNWWNAFIVEAVNALSMRKRQLFWGIILTLVGASGGLTACDTEIDTATSTPRDLRQTGDLAASATFLPLIPTEPEDSYIGRSDPTQAALAAEGQPSPQFEPTDAVVPTAISLPLQAFTSDGVLLHIEYYASAFLAAPTIILLHDANQDHGVWNTFAPTLRANGYNVIAPDQRGYGVSGGEVDWARSVGDIDSLLQTVSNYPEVAGGQTVFLGVGEGANVALAACARIINCRAAILISPRPSAGTEMDLTNALNNFNGKSLLLVSADDDTISTGEVERLNQIARGDYQWQRYGNGGRGLDLFNSQADLQIIIVDWLRNRLVAGQPASTSP